MKPRRLLSLCLAGMLALSATGCVNQHPEQNTDDGSDQQLQRSVTGWNWIWWVCAPPL